MSEMMRDNMVGNLLGGTMMSPRIRSGALPRREREVKALL
jgi:hypothetical protein